MSATITCRELVEFLADYLSGELDQERRRAFDEHLGICPACVAYLKSYAATIRLAKAALQAPDEPAPDDVPEALIQAILASRHSH